MSIEMVFSFFGVALTFVGMIGGVIVRDRQVMRTINEGDAELHRRVNLIQSDYVRRDDLDKHISNIEKILNMMHDEQRETTRRIDALLTTMSSGTTNK